MLPFIPRLIFLGYTHEMVVYLFMFISKRMRQHPSFKILFRTANVLQVGETTLYGNCCHCEEQCEPQTIVQ